MTFPVRTGPPRQHRRTSWIVIRLWRRIDGATTEPEPFEILSMGNAVLEDAASSRNREKVRRLMRNSGYEFLCWPGPNKGPSTTQEYPILATFGVFANKFGVGRTMSTLYSEVCRELQA